MAIIEQTIKTPYGALQVSLLKCERCGAFSTELAALGWIRLEPLGATLETFTGAQDLSGEYCSAECLMAEMVDQGVSVQPQASASESPHVAEN